MPSVAIRATAALPIGRQFASDDWIFNVDSRGRDRARRAGWTHPGRRRRQRAGLRAQQAVRVRAHGAVRRIPQSRHAGGRRRAAGREGRRRCTGRTCSRPATSTTPRRPCHIDRRYVYLHKYPEGPSFTKPGAKADILKNIAEGVTIWNYVGHGSPFKITDEGVFLDVDTGTLTNVPMFPVFISASCDVGQVQRSFGAEPGRAADHAARRRRDRRGLGHRAGLQQSQRRSEPDACSTRSSAATRWSGAGSTIAASRARC